MAERHPRTPPIVVLLLGAALLSSWGASQGARAAGPTAALVHSYSCLVAETEAILRKMNAPLGRGIEKDPAFARPYRDLLTIADEGSLAQARGGARLPVEKIRGSTELICEVIEKELARQERKVLSRIRKLERKRADPGQIARLKADLEERRVRWEAEKMWMDANAPTDLIYYDSSEEFTKRQEERIEGILALERQKRGLERQLIDLFEAQRTGEARIAQGASSSRCVELIQRIAALEKQQTQELARLLMQALERKNLKAPRAKSMIKIVAACSAAASLVACIFFPGQEEYFAAIGAKGGVMISNLPLNKKSGPQKHVLREDLIGMADKVVKKAFQDLDDGMAALDTELGRIDPERLKAAFRGG